MTDSGLSVKEAAAALGISERTARSRIKAGKLAAIQIERPQGYEWRVYPDGLPPGNNLDLSGNNVESHVESPNENQVDPPGNNVEAPGMVEMIHLVATLQSRNEQLAGQVGYLQRQVLEQQETIQRLLMAPKEPTDVTPEKPPVEPEPRAAPEPRRPWWRRLLGEG